MPIHKLSARKVITAPSGKFEDGGGLRLVVSKAGSKRWVFRYTLHGKRHEMGLGRFPEISLAEARSCAFDARVMVEKNEDPIQSRRRQTTETPTFTRCAAEYIRMHRAGWRSRKHAYQWVRTLKNYACPEIGSLKVDEIRTEDVLKALKPLWKEKTETGKRVQGRIENILDYAAAHNYRDRLNPACWRGHLDKILPRPSRVRQVRHHPAMPYEELPAFMQDLVKKQGLSALGLRLLILTATRTGEVIHARWSEIDTENRIWIIPGARTKTNREHRVPLSDAALEVLEQLPRGKEDASYLFPGTGPEKPLCNMAILTMMRKMGYGVEGRRGYYVPHGFRSTFRDWSGEMTSFPRDVAEMALAHAIGNKVEAAYRRGDFFEKRRKMMQAWAEYVMSGVEDGMSG